MIIQRISPVTGAINEMDLDVTNSQIIQWENGALIQNVMPHLNLDEREFLISGILPGEWESIFKED
jgi:hypothetical protein